MSVISFIVFGAAFAAAVWTLVATAWPEAHRIADLLLNGPVVTPLAPALVPGRSRVRNVTPRAAYSPAARRAAA
ncbi:hypothetical protein SAMN06297144_2970 [Sphingomonas guangdongensis]|uniref:Uncharacterized protein n=1 Tax=Sphingomonas guangdongensis TaxID=1141890 RepID=A0A285R140_9SPHN|nr:hypothetical protein [Sphingomonas guangdongensis]SOB87833.1 hypothetical protein SAMN06297144_2970 [Sphingomonas guangdongensis]